MSEERTFRKLMRIPMDEMLDRLSSIEKPSPIYRLGNDVVERSKFYLDIQFHLERVALLEKNGWKYDEFFLELEKKSILEQIKIFNAEYQFPMELVERAKQFFPNAKFTQASIELE